MNDRRQKIHDRIFTVCCMALVFIMPIYGKIVPSVIFLMVLNWIVEGKIKKIPVIFRERKRLIAFSFAALYIFYILGMIWSKNLGYGLFDLEVKFSLALFPMIFATMDKDFPVGKIIPPVFRSFVAGCVTMTLILLGIAIVDYLRFHDPDVFFYTSFTRIIHPSYLAMYLNFSIAIIAYWLIRKADPLMIRFRGLLVVMIFYLTLVVFLLNSKAGIFSLLVLFLLIILYYLYIHKHVWKTIFLLLLGVMIFYGGFRLFPSTFARFEKTGAVLAQKNDAGQEKMESNYERLFVWKAGWEVIRKHPLIGVGTGDVKDALLEEYQKEDNKAVYDMRLNAHNQYIQTFIALGIFGLMLMIFFLAWPSWTALKRKDFIYFAFLAVFAINILVESMLEVQAGVVYYAFMNALLFLRGDLFMDRSADPRQA